MKLSKEVKKLDPQDVLYMLSYYHQLPVMFNEARMFYCNKKYFKLVDGKPELIIPLYENEQVVVELDWLRDKCRKFKELNPDRVPNYKECEKRYKKLIKDNPWLTKELTEEAFELYFRSVDSKYLRTPQRFVLDKEGTSLLLHYAEQVRDRISMFNEKIL